MPATARPAPTPADVDAAIAASSSRAASRAPSAAGGSAAPRAATCADLEGGTDKLPPGPPAVTVTPRPAAVALSARRRGRAPARLRTTAATVSAAKASPASNPDFQRAAIQIRVEAARQRKHDHQNVKRQHVVKSALLDKEAQKEQSSEDRNVAAMGTVGQKQLAQSATFKGAKAKKFKEDFHAIVDANPPATERDARKLANREQAVQPFEGPFSKSLADQQAVVTKPLDQRARNEPAVEVAPTKEAKPIPRPVYPPAPGPVNPALVVPKPKPDPEVSLKEDSDRLDGAMQKNRLADDQLANSREPSFLKTLKAKQDAQQKIVEARSAYRRQESAILQGATAQANQSMSTELAGMSQSHTRTGGVVHTGQKGTESDTKRRQREIKKTIDDIYTWTADGVADILKCMTTKVTEDFRTSLKTQTEAFNKNVTKALDNYYSFGKKVKHFFLGEPKVVVDKRDRQHARPDTGRLGHVDISAANHHAMDQSRRLRHLQGGEEEVHRCDGSAAGRDCRRRGKGTDDGQREDQGRHGEGDRLQEHVDGKREAVRRRARRGREGEIPEPRREHRRRPAGFAEEPGRRVPRERQSARNDVQRHQRRDEEKLARSRRSSSSRPSARRSSSWPSSCSASSSASRIWCGTSSSTRSASSKRWWPASSRASATSSTTSAPT